MRERKYSSQEVLEQTEKLIADLKRDRDEWRKLPYRYICLFCGIPLRNAQPVLIQVRAHPNIEYRYRQAAVKIPTVIAHYVEAEENQVVPEEFAQFNEDAYSFLKEKISSLYDPVAAHQEFMYHMIFVEQLILDNFHETWCDLPYGYYAIVMGLEADYILQKIQTLEELKIVKRLGMSRMYRVALSDDEYKVLENSAYAKQQDEILERSKKMVEAERPPKEVEQPFTVLTELNQVSEAAQDILDRSYAVNEAITRQQLMLRTISDSLLALHEKESVYAGMAVRINAISQNYEEALKKSQDLEAKNRQLRSRETANDKYYTEQKKYAVENLESMLSSVLSVMEEYFALPTYEKNRPAQINKTKTKITRVVTETIATIEKGKVTE